ncbi:hypothetical protein ASE86_02450 [Sphingomonas sp. Leaf33]|uniref:hypothetical protein n=1 Tax=Sphingomonas sp. Leaf33 TaxID=1736215 RepID=UPI0006FBB9CF|nr:hypothetical protein [Sphingomonas sp. Leaf33]KQN25138.1 hypothetical protein ASE86_02450 [Sphingomonas sp. Leaf33]
MTRFALATVLLIAAPALARDEPVPPAIKIGAAVSCISTVGMRSEVRSDRVIDFTVAGRTYRNTLPQGCPGLGFDRSFAYRVPQPRLCDVDIITVLQSPGVSGGASCGLGKFQPIARPRRGR